jgi:outer membrane lipoprotein-sorting protein
VARKILVNALLVHSLLAGFGMYRRFGRFFHSVSCRALALVALFMVASASLAADPREIVRDAINHWRGVASTGEMTMTIHRADWERSMSFQSWTQGLKESLVRVTAPQKDRGNGTLMVDNSMWNYSPKVNRVIKVPSSMMGQSWMGSDFSNKDVSRADDIVDQYTHTLLETTEQDGMTVYVIEAVPLESAAVVWGREVLRIREDLILLEHFFYDQDGVLVKKLEALEIGPMGGRTVALRQRMSKLDNPDEWTEMQVKSMSYEVDLDSGLFTLSSLSNPRN